MTSHPFLPDLQQISWSNKKYYTTHNTGVSWESLGRTQHCLTLIYLAARQWRWHQQWTGKRSDKPGKLFECFVLFYADDGVFMFASREDMITGTNLLHIHLQRFGMLMHVGSRATETSEGSKSKTEEKQYISSVASPLLMRSNQTLWIMTWCVTVEAS